MLFNQILSEKLDTTTFSEELNHLIKLAPIKLDLKDIYWPKSLFLSKTQKIINSLSFEFSGDGLYLRRGPPSLFLIFRVYIISRRSTFFHLFFYFSSPLPTLSLLLHIKNGNTKAFIVCCLFRRISLQSHFRWLP